MNFNSHPGQSFTKKLGNERALCATMWVFQTLSGKRQEVDVGCTRSVRSWSCKRRYPLRVGSEFSSPLKRFCRRSRSFCETNARLGNGNSTMAILSPDTAVLFVLTMIRLFRRMDIYFFLYHNQLRLVTSQIVQACLCMRILVWAHTVTSKFLKTFQVESRLDVAIVKFLALKRFIHKRFCVFCRRYGR